MHLLSRGVTSAVGGKARIDCGKHSSQPSRQTLETVCMRSGDAPWQSRGDCARGDVDRIRGGRISAKPSGASVIAASASLLGRDVTITLQLAKVRKARARAKAAR